MKHALLFLVVIPLASLPVWYPLFRKQLREQREQKAHKRKWDEVRRNRLRDQQRSKEQKRALEARRREAAKVQLPKPKPTPTTQKPVASNSMQSASKAHKPPAPKPVPSTLLYKLDSLTKSRETSDRLVNGLAWQHPGKSRRWLVEKAIADLERDRY